MSTSPTKFYSSRVERMDPAEKAIWVTALRSGKYSQTAHRLHTDEGFCCLGVYAEVCKDATWVPFDSDSMFQVYAMPAPEGVDPVAPGNAASTDVIRVDGEAARAFTALLPREWDLGHEPIASMPDIHEVVANVPGRVTDDEHDDPYSAYPDTVVDGYDINLAELNDEGIPFSQIADLIDYFL